MTELRDRLAERGIASNRPGALENGGQLAAIVGPSGALDNLSPDDIGELLGGGTITMADPAEAGLEWAEEDESDGDDEFDDEIDDGEEDL